MSRLPILSLEDMSPEQLQVVKTNGDILSGKLKGPYVILVHTPKLAQSISNANSILKDHMTIRDKDYQLIIITVARRFSAAYMWGNHANFAVRDGVSRQTVDEINKGLDPVFEDNISQVIYDVTKALCCQNTLPQNTFDQAISLLGQDVLTEISTIVGMYEMFAILFNTFEVSPKEGAWPLSEEYQPYQVAIGTIDHTVNRMKPLIYEELTPEQQALYRHLASTRDGVVAGPFIARLRLPEICQSIQGISDILRTNTNLKRYMFEVITAIVAKQYHADYMWGVHARGAIKAGLDWRIVEDIRLGNHPVFADDQDQIIFDVANHLVKQAHLPQDLFDRAMEHLGLQLLIEVAADVGYYSLAASTVNTYAIPAKSGAPTLQESLEFIFKK